MKKHGIILLVMAFLLAPAMAQAVQFSIVGPRALGMGGASVAAVNDATAVYWNPAALAQFRKVDIRIPVSVGLHDHVGLRDKWDKINAIYDKYNAGTATTADLDQLAQLLLELDKPDTGADADFSAGLLAAIPIGKKSAVGISTLAIGYAGMIPIIDTTNLDTTLPPGPNSITANDSEVAAISLVAAEPGISFATSFGDKLFIGAQAKMMVARTYFYPENIRTGDFNNFIDNLDASKTSSNKFSADAGIMFAPSKILNIGVVGRYLNSPTFGMIGGLELEIEPQYRAGIAIKPLPLLTLTADYDLSKNKTLTPGYEDQTFAVGAEFTLPREIVSFRGGLYKNTADSNANVVYTAGLGFRIFALRLDLAGAYDFKEREGQASVDVALRF